MQLQQGTLLQEGKYKIVKVLGQGGFGITYLAEQPMLERKVCVKEFFFKDYCERDEETSHVTLSTKSNKEQVERFRKKFLKEARVISKLHHDHIIQIHDIFEENDTAYYVMEYVEGESLGEMIKRVGTIPEAQALHYVKAVASALDYIHSKSINHLDIKPGNIMLRHEDQRVLLIDFGVSKQYDEGTFEGTTTTPVGISHGYSPAEQYRKNGVQSFSPQSDVYALAATLYKLLTGITPPEAMIVLDKGLPVSELKHAGVSAKTIQAIEAAMLSHSKRTQRVAAFIAELDEPDVTVVPEPNLHPQPQPKPAPEPQPKPSMSKPVLYCIIAAAIISLSIQLLRGFGGMDDQIPPMPAPNLIVADDTTATETQTEENPSTLSANSTIGFHRGHEWTDLGLPSGTKWATMNVGATSPSDYGSYFSWGEIGIKNSLNNVDGKTELELSDDVAYMTWGSGWRIPTTDQLDELRAKCKWDWSSQSGHNGYKVVGPNGNTIFLPAAGYRDGASIYAAGLGAGYWSRFLNKDSQMAYYLGIDSCNVRAYLSSRTRGHSVRPVRVLE